MNAFALPTALIIAVAAIPAYAGPGHSSAHSDDMLVGHADHASEVDRSVTVTMTETDTGKMLFEPSALEVEPGGHGAL